MKLLDRPLALFYDANRARVLDVLLWAASPMSGREIAREADISPTTAGVALAALEDLGITRSRPVGRSYQWDLADGNILIKQLRKLAQLQDNRAGEIVVDALGEEPVSITLFGSTARGESGASSDVDLLIVASDFEQDLRLRRRVHQVSRTLRSILGRSIHVVVMNLEQVKHQRDGRFLNEVVHDGRVLRGHSIRELVS